MKLSRASAMLGVVTLASVISSPAMADDSGWYLGGNLGAAQAHIDDSRIINGLLDAGFTTTAIWDDSDHFGFKAFGGYQINRYLALESGYFNLGKVGFTANTLPPTGLRGDARVQGANFDVVGLLPLTESFAAFARVGYNYAYTKDRFAGSGAVVVANPERQTHAGNYKFGFGLQYALSRSWDVRVEAERYRVDDAVGNRGDIDLFTLGAVYRFGTATPPAPPPPPAPAVVAAEPPPVVLPPPPPPPPAPPVRTRVSFSADSLFDFDRSVVKAAGRQALDAFAARLRGDQFETITVTGYTDRIGSAAYNLKLSTRRAEAVKSYLVEAAGIPEGKITARGADGSDPVTKPDECQGQRRTPQLIACLQPDRRVDVEVAASRLQAAPGP